MLARTWAAPMAYYGYIGRSLTGQIHIGLSGPIDAETRAGLTLGRLEAERAAKLVGMSFALVEGPESRTSDLWAAIGDRPSGTSLRVPTLWLREEATTPGARAAWIGPSEMSRRSLLDRWLSQRHITPGRDEDYRLEDWHPTLFSFGAVELNDRYRRAIGRPMSAGAWRAWFAVRALVDAALRQRVADPYRALTDREFEGYKGLPLRFDATTGGLRQPLYVVRCRADGEAVVGQIFR